MTPIYHQVIETGQIVLTVKGENNTTIYRANGQIVSIYEYFSNVIHSFIQSTSMMSDPIENITLISIYVLLPNY